MGTNASAQRQNTQLTDPQRIRDSLARALLGLGETDLDRLAQVARIATYPPDTVVCQEGGVGATMYIILDGSLEVSQYIKGGAPRVLHHQGPGEFFGEMALIEDRPRAATVRTLEPCTLLELHKEEFNELLDRNPVVALTVMRKIVSRLRDSDAMAIADLHQKNLELAQAYAHLEEQQQLRSDFLTTVAHELRTPLTTVQGYLRLMCAGAIPVEQALDLVSILDSNVAKIVNLVNNILFLQELELITPKFEQVMVGELVTEAVSKVIQQATAHDLSLKIDIAPGLPPINGEAEGLRRAIAALVDNAIKFSPEGGEIHVMVTQQKSSLYIEVADPGVGIPEGQLERLFRPFDRVESIGGHLFGGVGLGLPIAKQVVELHGGEIRARRQPSGGSKFTIVLPIADAAPHD